MDFLMLHWRYRVHKAMNRFQSDTTPVFQANSFFVIHKKATVSPLCLEQHVMMETVKISELEDNLV